MVKLFVAAIFFASIVDVTALECYASVDGQFKQTVTCDDDATARCVSLKYKHRQGREGYKQFCVHYEEADNCKTEKTVLVDDEYYYYKPSSCCNTPNCNNFVPQPDPPPKQEEQDSEKDRNQEQNVDVDQQPNDHANVPSRFGKGAAKHMLLPLVIFYVLAFN